MVLYTSTLPPSKGGIQILGNFDFECPHNVVHTVGGANYELTAKDRVISMSVSTRSSSLAVQSRNFTAHTGVIILRNILEERPHFRILIASRVPLSRAASWLHTLVFFNVRKMLKELRTDSPAAPYFQHHPPLASAMVTVSGQPRRALSLKSI